ncbi:MAG TPA: hypothetical protein PLI68_13465 [Bacteroidia bacterium]|nr:hypothetical protein [Bacteroidia bacterium]
MFRFVSVVILVGIVLQSLSSAFLLAHYHYNKASITAKYCENKTKPKLKCHGQCHLRKQLKQDEQRKENPASPLKNKTDNLQYFQDFTTSILQDRNYQLVQPTFTTSTFHEQLVLLAVFHPPTV